MKTNFTSLLDHRRRLAGCLFLASTIAASAVAANNRNNTAQPSMDTANDKSTTAARTSSASGTDSRSSKSNDSSDASTIRVTRASTFMGTDVIASDGRKVGDIVDYVFDANGTPHLKYVIVMTGGVFDAWGDERAVPAEAITTEGDSARLQVSSDDYWNVAVLPQNRERFLNHRPNTDRLAEAFKGSAASSSSSSSSSSASTGKDSGEQKLVFFSELNGADAFDREGISIGRVVDAWVSLQANRAPYIELLTPPRSPFRVTPTTRFAIPLRQLQPDSETFGCTFDIAADELREAKSISETDGVERLRGGVIDPAVLRVRVAQQ